LRERAGLAPEGAAVLGSTAREYGVLDRILLLVFTPT